MKTTLIVLVALVLIGGGYYWYSQKDVSSDMQGKLNIDAVCRGALAYMTFPDAASAEVFVEECKQGDHPEVIEQYKAQMNLGDGAAI